MRTELTKRPLRTPTDAEIPSLLEALTGAGGNTAAFARERGLSPWKLYAARRAAVGAQPERRRRQRCEDEVDFVPVRVVEGRAAWGLDAALEVVLGAGHRLLIRPGFDEATLRRVMGVLRSC